MDVNIEHIDTPPHVYRDNYGKIVYKCSCGKSLSEIACEMP